jgi:hypothetical protein
MNGNQHVKIQKGGMNASIDLQGGGIQSLEADDVGIIKPSNDGQDTWRDGNSSPLC